MKTYRSWAEMDDWSSGRVFRRPAKRKARQQWKTETREELDSMADQTSYVYVIINSWVPEGSDVELSEIVDGRFFLDENEAWVALDLIAEAFRVELDGDDTSFEAPATKGIYEQTYYIEELTRVE